MDYDKLIAPAAKAMRPSGIRKFFDLAVNQQTAKVQHRASLAANGGNDAHGGGLAVHHRCV